MCSWPAVASWSAQLSNLYAAGAPRPQQPWLPTPYVDSSTDAPRNLLMWYRLHELPHNQLGAWQLTPQWYQSTTSRPNKLLLNHLAHACNPLVHGYEPTQRHIKQSLLNPQARLYQNCIHVSCLFSVQVTDIITVDIYVSGHYHRSADTEAARTLVPTRQTWHIMGGH